MIFLTEPEKHDIMIVMNEIENEIIKETVLTFSKKVEDLVWDQDISYFESITTLMNNMGLEPELVAKLLSPEIKSQLTDEMEKLRMIAPSKTPRLF